eukprot:TRINITY_DN21970_c0_g2_i1.p1 TRINITY_DN21970_c0_g2~~TRINITY_DN21970_c0_g2_i1.p1  ORF type:complete len:256 (+),score=39.21 TRINITY_DN21970_c0_g2_i1:58-825(+)
MIRRPPRSTLSSSSAASDVYKRQVHGLPALGYDGCVLNHEISGKVAQSDMCKLECFDVSPLRRKIPASVRLEGEDNFRQYTRITCPLDDEHQVAPFVSGNEVLRSYDLVAVRPGNGQMFSKCCNSLEIDIISLDLSSKLSFPLRPQLVATAVARGVVFEICYAESLQDASARRYQISNGQQLVRAARGRGILLSSRARHSMETRNAHDVVNLGFLFGLDQSAARAAVSVTVTSLLERAATRCTDAVEMMPMETEK